MPSSRHRAIFDRNSPGDVRALLNRCALASPLGFFPYAVIQEDFAPVVKAANALGQRCIGVPGLPRAIRSTRARVRRLADRFSAFKLDIGLIHRVGFDWSASNDFRDGSTSVA